VVRYRSGGSAGENDDPPRVGGPEDRRRLRTKQSPYGMMTVTFSLVAGLDFS
jgi:hypothetical protein